MEWSRHRRAGLRAGSGERRSPARGPADRSLDDWLLGRLSEEGLQAAPGAVVPGARVDPGRLGADAVSDLAVTRGVDLGDPVEKCAVKRRELLRRRLLVHLGRMGRSEADRNSPPVLPRGGRSGWSVPPCAPLRTPNVSNVPVAGIHAALTPSTMLAGGPSCKSSRSASRRSRGPSATHCTDPSPRLATQPTRPKACASRNTKYRKPTPWTRPVTRASRRTGSESPGTAGQATARRRGQASARASSNSSGETFEASSSAARADRSRNVEMDP